MTNINTQNPQFGLQANLPFVFSSANREAFIRSIQKGFDPTRNCRGLLSEMSLDRLSRILACLSDGEVRSMVIRKYAESQVVTQAALDCSGLDADEVRDGLAQELLFLDASDDHAWSLVLGDYSPSSSSSVPFGHFWRSEVQS